MKAKLVFWNRETRLAAKNASYLIESLSLIVAAFYNYYSAYHAHISQFEFKIRIAASVVIGLRGAYEFLRYLRNKEV